MKRILAIGLSILLILPVLSFDAFADEEETTAVSQAVSEAIEEIPENEDTTEEEETTAQTQEDIENTEGEPETPEEISEENKDNAPLKQSSELRGALNYEVDFSSLQNAYSKANSLLLDLDKKVALYSQSSMQTLLNYMSDSKISEYLGAEDLSEFDESDEEAADALAENIVSAQSALEMTSAGTDLSAYIPAVEAINNLDTDAYSETRSLGSATRISNLLVEATALTYTDPLNSENSSSVYCFTDMAVQRDINDATRTILDALYASIRRYTVTTSGAVVEASFQNGTSTGESSPYTATYGSTVIAYSDIEDTAWYLDYSNDSISRSRQFQGYGSSFRAKVFGNVNIYAEVKSSEAPNMVRIHRTYDNLPDKSAIQVMAFVDTSYTLPAPKAFPNYNFGGYYLNGNRNNPLYEGETISITKDTEIEAYYIFNSQAQYSVCATALENGTGYNDSAVYNQRIDLEGGDNAYGWIEEINPGEYRAFSTSSDVSLLVSESLTLFAVTEEQFNSYAFKLPAINMRKSGYITDGTKIVFNAQFVDPNEKVKEYGILIGVPKNGVQFDIDNLSVENAGSYDDYDIIRAKSTRNVGANQFSISINGLAGKDFVYKGYVIYERVKGEFATVYSE